MVTAARSESSSNKEKIARSCKEKYGNLVAFSRADRGNVNKKQKVKVNKRINFDLLSNNN